MTPVRPRYKWLRVIPLLGVMSLIFYLSHLPGKSLHLPSIVNIDKVLHCLAYATLGVAYLVALSSQWRRSPRLVGVSVLLFCFLYGVSDEFHQSFVPGRSVSGGDVVADVVGGLVAVVVFTGWQWYRLRASRR
ncbi:MAG: VanZ family protein [Desulfobulbus sp.]|nr:VanZ family protein [Desulfobulbus sp.]